jgi:hypothetical protein
MEVRTVIAEGDDWLMILDKDGDLCTVKRADMDVVRRPVIGNVKNLVNAQLTGLSELRKQLGLVGLIVFGSLATGCMTEHVLTHYQFEKMIEHALKNNPLLEDFNDD